MRSALSGIIKGTGSGFTNAVAGTDYVIPSALSSFVTTATTDSLDSRLDVIESDYVTSTELATKQDALPNQSGQAGKVLGTNGSALSWNPLPVVPIARWVLASNADLSSGEACTELADVPVGFTIVYVTVNAQTNGSGGGFTYNISVEGTNIWASAQSYAANVTDSSSVTTFTNSDVSAGDRIGLNIASTGTGVRNVSVTLWGRQS